MLELSGAKVEQLCPNRQVGQNCTAAMIFPNTVWVHGSDASMPINVDDIDAATEQSCPSNSNLCSAARREMGATVWTTGITSGSSFNQYCYFDNDCGYFTGARMSYYVTGNWGSELSRQALKASLMQVSCVADGCNLGCRGLSQPDCRLGVDDECTGI
jgi:hypothetical protein